MIVETDFGVLVFNLYVSTNSFWSEETWNIYTLVRAADDTCSMANSGKFQELTFETPSGY